MNKRTFLKLSTAFVTRSLFVPPFLYRPGQEIGTNWAGNYAYKAQKLHKPNNIDQLQSIIRSSSKVRILGTRHCFNSIADSPVDLVSLENISQEIKINRESQTVTTSAWIKYGELARHLQQNGYALHNLASLPHISIAGACATATHGSGVNNGNLATAVSGLEFITADGDHYTQTKNRDGDQFLGSVVGLGAVGTIIKVTLDIQPTYDVEQHVYRNLSFSHLEKHFDEIMSSGYSVSLFTDFKNKNINQIWIKNRLDDNNSFEANPSFFDATLADRHMHPIEDISAENCTRQMGIPGPWHERLPHFRMDFTPSSGDELQSEFFVPREHAYQAISKIFELSEQISPHLLISEIRTIDADDLWMSTCYKRPSVAIHFTWKPDWPAVKQLLPMIEEALASFDVRPHWGKLFTLSPDILQSRYEMLPTFKELLSEYDPDGKFRNDFLDRNLYG